MEKILSYIEIQTCQHLKLKEILQDFFGYTPTRDHYSNLTPIDPHTFQLVVTSSNYLQDFKIAMLDECPTWGSNHMLNLFGLQC